LFSPQSLLEHPVRKSQRIQALMLGSLLLSSQAGAQGAPMLAVTEQRNAAAGFVLTQALVVKKVVRTCQGLPQPFPADSTAAFESWMGRNKQPVKASQNWLIYVGTLMESKDGRPEAQAFLKEATAVFEARSNETLKTSFPTGSADAAECKKWLGAFSGAQFDVSANKDYLPDLKDLVAFNKVLESKSKNPKAK
jgi:hypothetical protein